MRFTKIVFALLIVSILIAPSALPQDSTAPHEIQMTAKKYEFSPSVITVKKGERVKLVITATDHEHGFKLEDFKVDQHLMKGEPMSVEFPADRVGEFHFHCSHFCGLGHPKMKGKLVVTE